MGWRIKASADYPRREYVFLDGIYIEAATLGADGVEKNQPFGSDFLSNLILTLISGLSSESIFSVISSSRWGERVSYGNIQPL